MTAMRRKALRGAAVALVLVLAGCSSPAPRFVPPPSPAPSGDAGFGRPSAAPSPTAAPSSPAADEAQLPLGGRTIFPKYRVVAYYGTAGNAALGVLGESGPEGILPRLRKTSVGFATKGRPVQIAFELIVTVAQAGPGPDGDYSRMIDVAKIRSYVDAARRNKVLVVLDVQPGRTDFLTQVRLLRPFLEQPHVGIALDPEWRMGPEQVPGKVIGAVRAAEVNAVAEYVAGIVRAGNLPEKLFILHQFRASMIPDIAAVKKRPGLAMVQHLDGFGTRAEKDATFNRLRRPQQFHIGYKLFYDEDVNMYAPRDVLRMRPTPAYVSYQ
jgi:hypothetical protein